MDDFDDKGIKAWVCEALLFICCLYGEFIKLMGKLDNVVLLIIDCLLFMLLSRVKSTTDTPPRALFPKLLIFVEDDVIAPDLGVLESNNFSLCLLNREDGRFKEGASKSKKGSFRVTIVFLETLRAVADLE